METARSDHYERELLRGLAGELSAERRAALERARAADADLAARLTAVEAAWSGLALPVSDAAPAGFRARVLAATHGRGDAAQGLGFGFLWASTGRRVLATAAVLVGVGLGLIAGRGLVGTLDAPLEGIDVATLEPTLAESWVEVWIADGEAGSVEP